MNCKNCGKKMIVERDIQNMRLGDETCMPCWRGVKHGL